MKLGAVLAAGVLVAGCGAGAVPPKDAGNLGVLAPASPTYSAPAYPAPTETPTPASVPATSSAAPVVTTTPAAPKTTAPKSKAPRTTTPAAPAPTGCAADYYRNSDGNCVHRPGDNPSGATAVCKDGTYSYSQHRSGTCSGHGGVRSWL
ncbi:DUF3761 domain-containing protein [Amycolatopsis vancoresmycina]|uniref:DUF3761 domain-containing protein n=1 Tax=Amycolatopsis vancoresmycina DSM 44592 TaxID=1292037 RepID=R1G8Y6_9PSEU|nr:hypothetical protein H480_14245 [Amycolatopsis vancoresmycina DSM 44592]